MSTLQKLQSQTPKTAAALAKAATRASDFLELSKVEFSEIVGMSSPQVSRLWKGAPILSESKKSEWERTILFYRVYRSLTTLIQDRHQAGVWLRSTNTALDGTPIQLMKSIEGLVDVVRYLDASRGNV
jgi:hypothetical protein